MKEQPIVIYKRDEDEKHRKDGGIWEKKYNSMILLW